MLQFKKVAADKKVEGKGKKKKVIESVNGGGDDMISETEFVDYFSKIMKVETSHAKALFRVADTSGDGFLEYREFLGLLSILCCGGWKRPAHLASDRASWPAPHGLGPALSPSKRARLRGAISDAQFPVSCASGDVEVADASRAIAWLNLETSLCATLTLRPWRCRS